ncbi:helix-turn-helix domain-containing protein [Priestia aryabhattai]|uniref:helix-turn-helix domain-containing protein n=1 Tax=Priestia aryabhattai TaxID=412384 RepID=UPI00211C839C|nr:helix-turn-helix transcriptional regulator [Priestia aryabhattai]MCQ9281721.1 helix-turn-helix domain-containing protein [Priestia aryabhattai]
MSGFKKNDFKKENLKRLLEDLGISHKELADRLGKSTTNIQEYISGKVKPRKETIKRIAEELGVAPIYLYKDIEEVDEKTYKDVYEGVSRYIWDLLKDANMFDISIREETITETSLLHIRKMIPKNFFIQQISAKTENVIGADWEWFIIKEGKWLGFRIQAKRLSIKEKHAKYETLHYTTDVKEQGRDKPDAEPDVEKVKKNQCQTLILNSWKDDRIPLYCFYNYLPNSLITELFSPNIQTNEVASVVRNSIKVDSSGLGWLFCYADHLFPTKNYDGDDNFKQVLKYNKNFQSMFSRDLEDIENEYNSINQSDDDDDGNDDDNGDGGDDKGNDEPGDSPLPGGSMKLIDKYIDKNEMPEKEFGTVQKSIKIKVKKLDELPIYAKKYLSEKTAFKFAKYDLDDKGNLEAPSLIVYSVFDNMPFTSINENEGSVESGPEMLSEKVSSDEQVVSVHPQKNEEAHDQASQSKSLEKSKNGLINLLQLMEINDNELAKQLGKQLGKELQKQLGTQTIKDILRMFGNYVR